MLSKVIWKFFNRFFWKRKCFVCSELLDQNCNTIRYKAADTIEIQTLHVCSKCSADAFIARLNRDQNDAI